MQLGGMACMILLSLWYTLALVARYCHYLNSIRDTLRSDSATSQLTRTSQQLSLLSNSPATFVCFSSISLTRRSID